MWCKGYKTIIHLNIELISLLNNKNGYKSDISHCISIRERNKDNNTVNDLFNSYRCMVNEMKLGDMNIVDRPLKPYNLLITSEWISLITRSTDRSNGFSINALGFAGYFLGTKNSNISTLIKFGPDKILKDVIEKD